MRSRFLSGLSFVLLAACGNADDTLVTVRFGPSSGGETPLGAGGGGAASGGSTSSGGTPSGGAGGGSGGTATGGSAGETGGTSGSGGAPVPDGGLGSGGSSTGGASGSGGAMVLSGFGLGATGKRVTAGTFTLSSATFVPRPACAGARCATGVFSR